MRNGDRLTCEIKKLDRGVLYVSLDYVDGTVSVEWSKVTRVESTQLFLVYTQDGSIYRGTLRTPETPAEQPVRIEVLESPQQPEVLERRNVIEMAQTAQSFWRRLSGNIDSGLIYTKGNDTTQYNIGSDLRIRRELWSANANYSSALSKSTGTTAATRNQLSMNGLRYIGQRKWYYAALTDFLQSSQQSIKLQSTIGGGIGRFLKETNNARIAVTGGLAWQNTQYESTVVTTGTNKVMTGLVALDSQLFKFKKTTLTLTMTVLPTITQAGRVRFNTNASYSIQIISNLWWKFSFYGNWDNRPPPTFAGSDYGTSSSLSYSFN